MTKLTHTSTHGFFKPLISAIVFGLSINCTNVVANESAQSDHVFNNQKVVRAIADKLAQDYRRFEVSAKRGEKAS